MSNKVYVTSDSTTDLSPELIERYNIKIIPLTINLEGETYRDGIDIDAEKIYDFNKRTGLLPKTSAVNVGEYIDFFEDITKDGGSVVHFSLSSEMSSTHNNASIAAADFDNVYCVDTLNLSTGGGLLVLAAGDMANEGLSAKEIAEKCNELAKYVDASFIINNLEFLHKGGRCSAVSVLGANLLKLKPCIEVKNGVMGVGKKYRGKFEDVLKEYIDERLQNLDDIDTSRVFVTHSGCSNDVDKKIAEFVKEKGVFDEVYLTRAGCTISSHCGPDTLGILFIRKTPVE